MVEIAARAGIATVERRRAERGERVREALSVMLGSPQHHAGLVALLLGVPDSIVDEIRRAPITPQRQLVSLDRGARKIPLLACDALLVSRGLSIEDLDWALVIKDLPGVRSMRDRFADLVALAGFPESSSLTVMRWLKSADELAHRACTIIDVISLLVCESMLPSRRCQIIRDALRAVVVCGRHHGWPMLFDIARRNEWDVHPKAAQLLIETLYIKRTAHERLTARGVLVGLS